MSTTHVEPFKSRTSDRKKAVFQALTEAAVNTLGCKPEGVEVMLVGVKQSNWTTGGMLWGKRD